MYMLKTLPAAETRHVAVDSSFLRFDELIHFSQRSAFDSTDPSTKALALDILSSALAALTSNQYVTRTFVEKNLQLCRQIILDQGYVESNRRIFRSDLVSPAEKMFILFGCQTTSLLRMRCEAFLQACCYLTISRPNLFIAGLNDGSSTAKTPNETRRMLNLLDDMITLSTTYRHIRLENDRVHYDVDSTTTPQNVGNVLRAEVMARYADVNRIYVLISSTFHLLRLREFFENRLPTLTKKRNLIGVESEKIKSYLSLRRDSNPLRTS